MASTNAAVRDYKPPKPTYLTKYVVFPFYDWIVRFYPHCWTPNAITLFGIFSTVTASVLLLSSIPRNTNFTPIGNDENRLTHVFAPYLGATTAAGTHPAHPLAVSVMQPQLSWISPEVALLLAGILNLVYCIADNTDGRQARRTQRSSHIGEYLDHGLDCVTSLMSAFLLLGALGISLPLAAVGVLTVAYVTVLSHTVNHEHNILIWGNDWASVDEAMLAFGAGLWVPVLFPSVPAATLPLCIVEYVPLLGGVKVVELAFALFLLSQLDVMRLMLSMDRTVVVRAASLFMAANGIWFFLMLQHPQGYQSGQYTALAARGELEGKCCKALLIAVESLFSYPALWAIATAFTSSIICHVPIVAKCAGLQRCELAPLALVLLVWYYFNLNPVYGSVIAVAGHVGQVLFNVAFVQNKKQSLDH